MAGLRNNASTRIGQLPLQDVAANLNEKKAADRPQAPLGEAKVNPDPARRRTAAQSVTTKRKAGTVSKSQSGKRSTKAKRKVGSVRRGKRLAKDKGSRSSSNLRYHHGAEITPAGRRPLFWQYGGNVDYQSSDASQRYK